jgi:hypothetical protein
MLHNFISLSNIIKMIKEDKMGRSLARIGEECMHGFGRRTQGKETTKNT